MGATRIRMLHIIAVVPYSILGAVHFAPAFRRRHPRWHRAAGGVLVALGLSAALTGLWMAHFYPWPAGDGRAVYTLRLVFGSVMVAATLLAVDAIRRREYVEHGAWMTRAYAIGMGAGTQAVTHAPYFVFVGQPDETARAVLMGAGWVINVVVAEWAIRRRIPGNTVPYSRLENAATRRAGSWCRRCAARLG